MRMTFALIAATLAALLTSAAAQTSSCAGPSGPPAGECVVTADGPIEIPFRILNNHVLIPVSVNGSAPLDVILDTGMPVYGVILHPCPDVDAIAFDTEGAPQVMIAGSAAESQQKAAVNVTIGLPGVEFRGQLAIIAAPCGPTATNDHDAARGVIGLSVFQNFVVTFDHDRGVLVLTRPGEFVYEGDGARIPFTLGQRPVPEIECTLGTGEREVPLRLTVDTGASHNVSLMIGPEIDIVPPPGARPLVTGYSYWGELSGLIGRAGTIRLGDLALEGILVTYLQKGAPGVPPCGRDGILGNGALRRFNVTFDYSRAEMILEPNSRTAAPFEFNMSGLALQRADDGAFKVAKVFENTPGAETGILVGDVIAAVDGRPTHDIAQEEMREMLERDGATVSLDVVRDGDSMSVILHLRRLV